MPVEVIFQSHPMSAEQDRRKLPDGLTIAGIIAQVSLGKYHDVVLVRGEHMWNVKPEHFGRVRPTPDTIVIVRPRVRAAALVPVVAGWLGGIGITGMAATVIAGFAISAVVYLATTLMFGAGSSASQSQMQQDKENPTIRGLQNVSPTIGTPLPMVLGRVNMAAVKTATGYTQTVGQQQYRIERMTFGVGPVALDELKIGTTLITKFKDVSLQFRNVDETLTRAAMPGLAAMDCTFLSDSDPMTLYSLDLFEDADGARLDYLVPLERTTPADTARAIVQIAFNGLVKLTNSNGKEARVRQIGVYYRASGSSDPWITASEENYKGRTTATLRFGVPITFPTTGAWDIKVVRLSEDDEDSSVRDDSYLLAIQSIAPGALPSPAGIAEVAIRVLATDQISGTLDPINAVVQQLAPVWTGSAFGSPEPVRHPADIYVQLLRGPMRKKPVADAKILLDQIKAWKEAWPGWTCDRVITSDIQLGQLIREVLACGLVMPAQPNGKYSVLTDKSDQPAVQMFTPRNVANINGTMTPAPKVHAFRMPFISERAGWQEDQVLVYANGYDASNATEIETLEMPGLVLETGGSIEKIARIGYYHLAQLQTRTTEISFQVDLEHLICTRGDPVIHVSDLLKNELINGRVAEVVRSGSTIVSIGLDNTKLADGVVGHVMVRASSGVLQYVTATLTGGLWVVTPGSETRYSPAGAFDADEIQPGDLAIVYEYATAPQKWLVRDIAPEYGEIATLTLVPATEVPLNDLTRPLPEFSPVVTYLNDPINLVGSVEYEDGAIYVLVRWSARALDGAQTYRVTLDDSSGNPVGHVIVADQTARFQVQSAFAETFVAKVAARRSTGLYGEAQSLLISSASQFAAPSSVANFQSRVVGDQIYLTWARGAANIDYYELRYSSQTTGATWGTSVPVVPIARGEQVQVAARNGTYLIKAVTYQGAQSTDAVAVVVTSANAPQNAVETLTLDPNFAGTMNNGLVVLDGELLFASDGDIFDAPDMYEVADMFTWGRTQLSVIYTSSEIVDLGAVDTARVSADVAAYGFYPNYNTFDIDDLFSVPDMFGGADGQWSISVQISVTDDDPAGAPVWSDWTDLVVGDYRARAYRFRLSFAVIDPQILVKVTGFSATVDMPDRREDGADVTVPVGGVTISFSPSFRAITSLTVNPQGLPSGGTWEISGKSAAGFTITLFDSGASSVAGTFDYQAIGYGRQGA